jgi:hypothetical protein
MPVPVVVVRLAIVGLATLQKFCGDAPVGAAGSLMFTVTGSLVSLSQLPTVCVA